MKLESQWQTYHWLSTWNVSFYCLYSLMFSLNIIADCFHRKLNQLLDIWYVQFICKVSKKQNIYNVGGYSGKIRQKVFSFYLFPTNMKQVLLSLQVMKMHNDTKEVHTVRSEFCSFFWGRGGLSTLCFLSAVFSFSKCLFLTPCRYCLLSAKQTCNP